ncbi:MAG: Hsp70 family protein [Mycobacterium sp.]
MSESLGLSIGTTNLVAAHSGQPPVSRRAILTLFDDRPPEVGVPAENPNIAGPGMVLAGFVERVGDPVPLVAADGSAHRGELLLAEALDALVRGSAGTAPTETPTEIAIAVPAHWSVSAFGALRGAIRGKPSLSVAGVGATLIPDSAAALAALSAGPGLPGNGIVALCDFGGTGTSITLADAGARFAAVGETVRYPEFSGAQIDQALLTYVMDSTSEAGDSDPASTAAVGSLGRLRDACRQAKERLSAETVTSVPTDLPGYSGDVRITRTELENLIAHALTAFLGTLAQTLQRNNLSAANLAAVATVGGGAAIPLITQRLSEQLRVPIVTTPTPAFVAAAGAALLAERGPFSDDATGMATVVNTSDAPTGMSTAAWAGGAAGAAGVAGVASDGAPSSTFRALAWSQDDSTGGEPVPYAGEDYPVPPYESGQTGARPPVNFVPPDDDDAHPGAAPLPWYRRPAVIFGAAAAAAVFAIGGLAYTLTSSTGSGTETTSTSGSVTETVAPTDGGSTQAPPVTDTVTVTDSNGSPVPPSSSVTTTTTAPTTTTTPPTTTTTATTTTATTTTATTTTATTTTATTTRTTTTTTSPPPTTTRITTTSDEPYTSIITGVPAPDPVDPVIPDEPDAPAG